jgi:hypothetical protein
MKGVARVMGRESRGIRRQFRELPSQSLPKSNFIAEEIFLFDLHWTKIGPILPGSDSVS